MAEIDTLRVPPSSIEAEQAVLGALLLPGVDKFDEVADIVSEDDFYRHDHQLIYRAIRELANKRKPHDALTVAEWFDSVDQSHEVEGGAYLIHLASNTPSAANLHAYARIVKDKAILRSLIDAGTQIINTGYRPDGRDTADILAEAEAAVLKVAKVNQSDIFGGDDALRSAVAELSRRRKMHPDALLGISTSLDLVDSLTHGLQPTDLIILAARPSMGKTAFAIQMALAAAMDGKRPYFATLEMSREQWMMRALAAVGQVDFSKVQRTARASAEEMERIQRAVGKLRGMSWWIDEAPGMNLDMLAAKLRRMKKQHDIGVAFIDYLQYLDLTRQLKNTNGNTASAIQEVTRRLKAVAKELRIPVVLLSQLNRALEGRRDKRPMLSDLRESGAIEQDADLVMFLHREGYYEGRDWPRDDPRHALAEVIIAKSRNGIVDTARVRWDGPFQRFDNLAYNDPITYYNPSLVAGKGGFEPKPVMMPGRQPVNQMDED